jgi:hypothetical protein
LNPILTGQSAFHLVFNIATGRAGGFDKNDKDVDLPFTQKQEPATYPLVDELTIITSQAPWPITIRNKDGVTLGDVCGTLWRQ